jgi:hypothetical protein
MGLADELLVVADELRNGASEGHWRRSASSAYYASFQRMVDDSLSLVVGNAVLARPYSRSITHSGLLKCAKSFEAPNNLMQRYGVDDAAVIPSLRDLSEKLRKLYGLRIAADYNREGFAKSTADQAYVFAANIFTASETLRSIADVGYVCMLAAALLREPQKD